MKDNNKGAVKDPLLIMEDSWRIDLSFLWAPQFITANIISILIIYSSNRLYCLVCIVQRSHHIFKISTFLSLYISENIPSLMNIQHPFKRIVKLIRDQILYHFKIRLYLLYREGSIKDHDLIDTSIER